MSAAADGRRAKSSPLTSGSRRSSTGRRALVRTERTHRDGERSIITLPRRLVLRASLGLDPLSADNLTATGGGARNTAS